MLQFRTAVGLGEIEPAAMHWILEERRWWDRVFGDLPATQLEGFYPVLLELMRRGNDEWSLSLPHLFRLQALREEIGPEKRAIATDAVIQSVMACGHRGALTLLVREATALDLLANFTSPGDQGPAAYAEQMLTDHPEPDAAVVAADAVLAVEAFHSRLFDPA